VEVVDARADAEPEDQSALGDPVDARNLFREFRDIRPKRQ